MKINLKIKIKNTEFNIASEASEEEKIKRIAYSLDRKINLLSKSFPNTNLMTLFLINSIMMEDELNDLKIHSQDLAQNAKQNEEIRQDNEQVDFDLEEVTAYIDKIVAKIEEE